MDKFGVSEEIIGRYKFCVHGKSVWAYTGECVGMGNLEVVGIRALRVKNIIKPTTAFLRVIGKYCTKNVICLDDNEALQFLKGNDIRGEFNADPGFVVVRSKTDILGCGLLAGDRLISQIPKKYRVQDSWL